jgi:hypothetical protein
MDINQRMYRALEWPDIPKRQEPKKAKPEPSCEPEEDSVS